MSIAFSFSTGTPYRSVPLNFPLNFPAFVLLSFFLYSVRIVNNTCDTWITTDRMNNINVWQLKIEILCLFVVVVFFFFSLPFFFEEKRPNEFTVHTNQFGHFRVLDRMSLCFSFFFFFSLFFVVVVFVCEYKLCKRNDRVSVLLIAYYRLTYGKFIWLCKIETKKMYSKRWATLLIIKIRKPFSRINQWHNGGFVLATGTEQTKKRR